MIDPNLPAAKLCMEGMQAEGAGNQLEARRCFAEAWEASTTPFERAISAHYLARGQESPEEELRWNQAALENAQAVPDQAASFMPSLLGCVGLSHEKLGNTQEAVRFMHEAKSHFDVLQDDAYGELVQSMVSKALIRLDAVSAERESGPTLTEP